MTGEAPLVDVTASAVGGVIDPRQVQELPIQGRSWQDLAMIAPGSQRNESGDSPTVRNRRDFQINLDGQQTTSILVTGGGFGTGRAAAAALQPGCHRRVPVRRVPFRRDAGPLDRDAGECGDQVGDEQAGGIRSRATSATIDSRPGIS